MAVTVGSGYLTSRLERVREPQGDPTGKSLERMSIYILIFCSGEI